MEDKEVGTILGGCTLNRYRRSHDDGTLAEKQILLLLPGEDITQHKEQQQNEASEETNLTQPDTLGEEI